MNKLFFIISTLLILIPIQASASTFLDARWQDSENDFSISVEQGTQVTYTVWVSTTTDMLSYIVRYDNGENFTIVNPHTVINTWDHSEDLTIDTSSWETGTYQLLVSANDDGSPTDFDITTILTLTITTIQENNAPTINSLRPIDGSTDVLTNLSLYWDGQDSDGDNLYYTIFLGTSESLSEQDIIAQDIPHTKYKVYNLEYETTYYWKVIVEDEHGLQTSSETISFTTETDPENGETNHAPDQPTNPVPNNGATGIDLAPTLSWEATDVDGDSLEYKLYFGLNSNPTEMIAENLENEYYSLSNLDYNTQYYWKVVASDGEFETSSDVWSFTTKQEGSPEENHAPEIEKISNEKIRYNKPFRLQVEASDVDGDQLTYLDNSRLFNIDKNTGLISFIPSFEDIGKHQITITVVDEHGATATETFELLIYRTISSGGGSSEEETTEETNNTETIKVEGICVLNPESDTLGMRTVLYKVIDLFTREVYSTRMVEESCIVQGETSNENTDAEQYYDYDYSENIIAIVALLFLIVTVPIVFFVFKKIS